MLDIRNPWQPVTTASDLAAHMGVFELADAAGAVLFVGYAGGNSRYGLRSEVQAALATYPQAVSLRFEVNTAYLTRFQELIMLHESRGTPVERPETPLTFGTLQPG